MKSILIDTKDLKFTYKDASKAALEKVSLSIESGSWTAIVGHNGSGKSTLARAIDGLIAADSGQITVDGLELNEQTVWDIRERIGLVFQNPDNQFVGATVADDVAFGLENQQIPREEMVERVHSALETVGMQNFANREPSSLSGGQKQRVALAGAIALKPKILILDEATSMLDPEGRAMVLDVLQKLKEQTQLTIISITHDIEEAALAEQIVVLNNGEIIAQDQPEIIFSQGNNLKKWGLNPPYAQQLKNELERDGLKLPDEYMTNERMVEWLWQQLNSKI